MTAGYRSIFVRRHQLAVEDRGLPVERVYVARKHRLSLFFINSVQLIVLWALRRRIAPRPNTASKPEPIMASEDGSGTVARMVKW
jgi:hypothetical protein